MRRGIVAKWIVSLSIVLCAGVAVVVQPGFEVSAGAISVQLRRARVAWTELSAGPLRFEQNAGQTDPRVDYLARGRHYAIFLSREGAVLSLRGHTHKRRDVVKLGFAASNPAPIAEALDRLEGESHYLQGNNPHAWRTHVPSFGKVRYRDVYPGVDVVYYGQEQKLEYDLVVAPGSDPSLIRLVLEGADRLDVDRSGDLLIALHGRELRMHKPVVYQNGETGPEPIAGGYTLLADNSVGFKLGAYDRNRPLVIDPILGFSTYLGGDRDDEGNGIAVDAAGNVYVTGLTESTDFPESSSPFQNDPRGKEEAFVTKLNPAGGGIVFSTYLGGDGDDIGNAVAVDSAGFVYVTGLTKSTNFPTPGAAVQRVFQGGETDCFVTKLTPGGGEAIFSTYLGGNDRDRCTAIALDAAGNAHVVGVTKSSGFPKSGGVFRPERDGGEEGFITKYNAAGSAILFSMVLGGGGDDGIEDLALDSAGNIYTVGYTKSDRFPVTPNAVQGKRAGDSDAFASKLSPDGGSLLYSTFLGGNNDDIARGIALDSQGNIYVTGLTNSFNFPTSQGAFQRFFFGGTYDAFLTKYDAQGRGVFSTYIGGEGEDLANSIAVDSLGLATIAGVAKSFFFPVVSGQINYGGGPSDAFVTQFNTNGSDLLDSTYLGAGGADEIRGLAIDSLGRVYVTGFTNSNAFPVTQGVFQGARRNGTNAFVTRFGNTVFATVSAAAPGLPQLGVAPDSLASGFGGGWTGNASAQPGQSLPPELAGVRAFLIDSANFEFTLPLLAVVTNPAQNEPSQINFLVPPGAALGEALIEVEQNNLVVSRGVVRIRNAAPAIFTANANGEGVPAATALRVRGDGGTSEELVFSNAPLGSHAPVPINLGPESDRVFLILFGTGLRKATTVTATIGGMPVTEGIFFGAQSQFAGLDQVNIPLPRTLIGRGVVNVVLTVDGQASNVVQINVL